MTTPAVLVIEDDSVQANTLARRIQERFPGVKVKIINTESNFHKQLPSLNPAEVRVAVVDMMLRWADPAPEMEMPSQEIIDEGFFVGGLRCRKALVARGIPAIIYTVLDRESVPGLKPPEIEYVRKGPNAEDLLTSLSRFLK